MSKKRKSAKKMKLKVYYGEELLHTTKEIDEKSMIIIRNTLYRILVQKLETDEYISFKKVA